MENSRLLFFRSEADLPLMPKARRFCVQPPGYSRAMSRKPDSFTLWVNILTEMHRRKIECPCSKTQQALRTDTCIAVDVF